ncbi:filamentous hemagglutinin, partial [Erwinia sp. OLMDLW33]
YGTGSDLQKAAQAVTGALTALAGNNLAGALASGASPYLATEIKKLTTNPLTGKVDVTSNAMAHAVLGAVTAQLNNQSAVAGGLGAGGGELAARYIAGQLFPGKTADQLSESEKQQVSALSQLAAGLAGGLASGDTGGAVTAAQAGKNAVENNYLSNAQKAQKDKEIAACQTLACKAGAQAKWTAIDLGQDGSFAAGMVAGVPAGLYDTIDSIVKTASNPQETYDALKSLFNSGDVLGNVSDAVKQSYIERINRMEAEYQKAGASGSFNAGVKGGKLVTDIAGLLAGGAGVVKGGAVLTEKVVAKTTGMVETALKSSVVNKILEANRIGSGLKPDPTHRGASYLSREQLMDGKVFTIKGGDGIERKLLQAEDSFNDKKGIFEYIYDNKGNVTHQRFIEGGNITGIPNQRPPKVK